MTDLTTAHLRHLLAQSTPGPWEYEGGPDPCLVDT